MARLTLQELRGLVRKYTNWEAEGWLPPETVLLLAFEPGSGEPVLDTTLSKKTLSYEGRDVTVNIDFDEQGYVVGLEFV